MSRRLEMILDPEEDKLSLHSSSEDEEENSEESDEEPVIEDPFAKDDSDSDSAPEALSFRDALEDDRAKRQQTSQVIRTQMEERKKKRKEIQDEFLRKKEEKRQKIESKMLPDDFLDDLEEDDDPLRVKSSAIQVKESNENEAETVNDDVIAEDPTDEDVLAVHGPTVFMCKTLKQSKRNIPEKYLTLKDQLLYGKRVRREKSARAGMLKRQKQLMHHGHVC